MCCSHTSPLFPQSGITAYGGFLLGIYEADRRHLSDLYHEGAIILVLQIACIVSALIFYDWIGGLIQNRLWQKAPNPKVAR